jgi:hypothetical protein
MDEAYNLNVVPQETRFGATTQHIPGEEFFKGGALHKKLLTGAYHGATMSSDLEGDAPDSYEMSLTDLTIEESDLREIAFTISHTTVAQTQSSDPEHSAYDVAKRLVMQAMSNVGERRNQALNQNANCQKALVAAKYNEDGSTYTNGQADAFLKIDNGSISMFHPGEVLDIIAEDDADVRTSVIVNDVCHAADFLGVSGIGPGVVVTIDTTYRAAADGTHDEDTDLDNVVDNDLLVRHNEYTGDGFPASFSTLIDLDSSPSTYFSIDRSAKGNFYLVPYGRSYLSGGANVNLNLEDHFGEMVDVMAMVLGPSRIWRGRNDFKLTNAIVAQAQPDLVNEIARQAGTDNARFTREMSSQMDAARKSHFVANAGWDGAVLHHPGFPPIIVQPEPLCPPNVIRMFEPSAFTFIRLGGRKPNWIRQPNGSMWHVRRNVTSGNLTKRLDASAYVHETLFCDQPKLIYEIQGVKSSLKSS